MQALRALDAIHERLESPANRLLRSAGARSSYIVLPLFALANAGFTLTADIFEGRLPLIAAIVTALTVGKPIGIMAGTVLAVAFGLTQKPKEYTWGQLMGAACLAGIGFTMSLFIAEKAFGASLDFTAAKIAVFVGSTLSGLMGIALIAFAASRQGKRVSLVVTTKQRLG